MNEFTTMCTKLKEIRQEVDKPQEYEGKFSDEREFIFIQFFFFRSALLDTKKY